VQIPSIQVLETQSLSALQDTPSQLSMQNMQVAFTQLPLKQSPSVTQVAPSQCSPIAREHEAHILLMQVFEAHIESLVHDCPSQSSFPEVLSHTMHELFTHEVEMH
jgi:hypothetical protein